MSAAQRSEILELYPALGHLAAGGRAWIVPIRGQLYATGKITLRQRIVLGLLRPFMRATKTEFQSSLFHERMSSFLGRPLKNREVVVYVGDRSRPVRLKTTRLGQFAADVTVPLGEVRHAEPAGLHGERWLNLRAIVPEAEENAIENRALLLPPTGVSVISDIDDTIKHTGVAHRREMLTNTFLRPFRVVPGMAGVYRRWAEQGAAFHYVSSSPWQLYRALDEFQSRAEFPEGTFHLRSFRLRDHMLQRLLLMRRTGKKRVISGLLKLFPRRQFVMVGDSAEKDAEIYTSLARTFPQQIARILIRSLSGRVLSERRLRKLRRKLDPELLQIYEGADDLGELPIPSVVVSDGRR